MAKEPLYPHVPKKKEPLFPHTPAGQTARQIEVRFWDGTRKYARDAAESIRIVNEGLDAWMEKGDRIEWHLGASIDPDWEEGPETFMVFATVFTREGGLTDASARIIYSDLPLPPTEHEHLRDLLAKTDSGPGRVKLYQRGPDGYPVGSDKRMREGYGQIPDPDQPFQSKKGWEKPAKIYGWQWSDHFHRWTAFVRFPDGYETWTYPQHRAGGSLKGFLAKTTGGLVDTVSKYCCSQCDECAPAELLEGGRFFDRISWLRRHYDKKHPGMWGEMSPMTILAKTEPGPLPTRDEVEISTWQERDRLGIWITDKRTDKTIAEWWDENAREMFEDGFFKPGVPTRDIDKPSRAFLESVLDYAESVGLIAGRGEYMAQTVKPEHRHLIDMIDEPLPPDAY